MGTRMFKLRRPDPSEAAILNQVKTWLELQSDVTIFRNNTGAWKDPSGRPIRYGLGVGSADLVGSLYVKATATVRDSHVLTRWIARSLAIEVKSPTGKPTEAQERWLEARRKVGWIVGVVRSLDDVRMLVEKARKWEL